MAKKGWDAGEGIFQRISLEVSEYEDLVTPFTKTPMGVSDLTLNAHKLDPPKVRLRANLACSRQWHVPIDICPWGTYCQ